MHPFTVNGELWRVVRVNPGDPSLVDWAGVGRLATADPLTRTISIDSTVEPPLLDRVLLHEIAHAVTMAWGLVGGMRRAAIRGDLAGLEEWAAQLIENHSIEALDAAITALGRPICVRGHCHD